MPDIPYQNEAQIEQALAERDLAEVYGQTTLIEAADKVLASFGITSKADRAAAAKHRKAAAEESDEDAKSSPPKERSSAKKSTAKKS
jgi:hypothetical protein